MATVRGSDPRGFALPIRKGRDGYWPRMSEAAMRRSSIMMILGTIPGERVGEPTFGSRLFELVFEPNDKMLLSQLVHETADAISLWDSLIQIVNVTPEYGEDSVKLFIDYVDKADPTLANRRATFSSQR